MYSRYINLWILYVSVMSIHCVNVNFGIGLAVHLGHTINNQWRNISYCPHWQFLKGLYMYVHYPSIAVLTILNAHTCTTLYSTYHLQQLQWYRIYRHVHFVYINSVCSTPCMSESQLIYLWCTWIYTVATL